MTDLALHQDRSAPGSTQLDTLPPFMRPSGRYWHMPRSAYVTTQYPWDKDGRLVVVLWCGSHRYAPWADGRAIVTEFVSDRPEFDVCATCHGRATAHMDGGSGLVFEPRNHFKDPTWCPMLEWPASGRDCPLCGHRVRAAHGWQASGVARHKPDGPLTAGPCPHHGWPDMACVEDGMYCRAHGCDFQTVWPQP